MINSIQNNALTGIRSGMERMQGNAQGIAGASSLQAESAVTLVESMVDLKANLQQVQASMQVLKTADELVGTLLDIRV